MTIDGHPLTWLAALLLVGAAWRISRLIVTDQWPGWYQLRGRILRKWPPGPARPTELLVCPWCIGVWIAGTEITLWWFFPGPTLLACLILTVSAVSALITAWTD